MRYTMYGEPILDADHDAEYMSWLQNGVVPERPHSLCSHSAFNEARDTVTSYGMWAQVTQSWVNDLAQKLNGRRCLEVMAGRGWLALALENAGVCVVATDDKSWGARHGLGVDVTDVVDRTALDAVVEFGQWADVLICSWPPYKSRALCEALDVWYLLTGKNDFVYIGEEYGCNGTPEFFRRSTLWYAKIDMPMWRGLHDGVYFGKWNGDTVLPELDEDDYLLM